MPFLGSLNWRPNLDAIGLLLDRIFPAVRAANPGPALHRRPQAVRRPRRRIQDVPGVELHADVPDVRPFLAEQSGMMVVPRIGGGIEIEDPRRRWRPLARWSRLASDLVGEHYIPADEPERIAAEFLACIRDPRPARAMAGPPSLRQSLRLGYAGRWVRVWSNRSKMPRPSSSASVLTEPVPAVGKFARSRRTPGR